MLIEERVVVVVVRKRVDGTPSEDELSEEVGGISGGIVSVGEMHFGVPKESRLHWYPPAGGKISEVRRVSSTR